MDAIFHVKRQFGKNEIHGHISSDIPKAFGGINRNKLWRILYGKGPLLEILRKIIQGRTGNIPHGENDGELGAEIINNKGAFQGSPISALLYITYADAVMAEYEKRAQNT